jgi:hypothetical protein
MMTTALFAYAHAIPPDQAVLLEGRMAFINCHITGVGLDNGGIVYGVTAGPDGRPWDTVEAMTILDGWESVVDWRGDGQ